MPITLALIHVVTMGAVAVKIIHVGMVTGAIESSVPVVTGGIGVAVVHACIPGTIIFRLEATEGE